MKHSNSFGQHRRFGKLAAIGLTAVAALGVGAHAFAHDGMRGGAGGGFMSMHGGGFGGPGAMDPERAKAFTERRVRHMAGQVGASEAQINQIVSILTAARTELAATGQARQDGRRAIAEALSKPTIDRRALEQLRQQQAQAGDRASQRMTQAMADAAEVLDPQQRQKLFELMQSRRGGRQGGAQRG
jgi:periplasmic protein CpxP/Spy